MSNANRNKRIRTQERKKLYIEQEKYYIEQEKLPINKLKKVGRELSVVFTDSTAHAFRWYASDSIVKKIVEYGPVNIYGQTIVTVGAASIGVASCFLLSGISDGVIRFKTNFSKVISNLGCIGVICYFESMTDYYPWTVIASYAVSYTVQYGIDKSSHNKPVRTNGEDIAQANIYTSGIKYAAMIFLHFVPIPKVIKAPLSLLTNRIMDTLFFNYFFSKTHDPSWRKVFSKVMYVMVPINIVMSTILSCVLQVTCGFGILQNLGNEIAENASLAQFKAIREKTSAFVHNSIKAIIDPIVAGWREITRVHDILEGVQIPRGEPQTPRGEPQTPRGEPQTPRGTQSTPPAFREYSSSGSSDILSTLTTPDRSVVSSATASPSASLRGLIHVASTGSLQDNSAACAILPRTPLMVSNGSQPLGSSLGIADQRRVVSRTISAGGLNASNPLGKHLPPLIIPENPGWGGCLSGGVVSDRAGAGRGFSSAESLSSVPKEGVRGGR